MEQQLTTLTLTDTTFASTVQESTQPLLVDFWADWCGPCHVMGPIIDELAADLAGTVKVAKVNVDDYPQLAVQFGIHSIPTLLVFQDGQVVDKAVGVVSKQALVAKLEALEQAA
ncbi:MAG: thioredoxin [Candidatus Entotheonella factor]|uniref:Thioredoxin n=1 Tax=Entotheonella factor TaxID=1429438 RepID=W4LM02_ENTF1|nr:thioredoxin [Candidatus Entotheonella palauensis]ETW98366.1 MAG: thioredoxin [Candidatus Entotheonella factor]